MVEFVNRMKFYKFDLICYVQSPECAADPGLQILLQTLRCMHRWQNSKFSAKSKLSSDLQVHYAAKSTVFPALECIIDLKFLASAKSLLAALFLLNSLDTNQAAIGSGCYNSAALKWNWPLKQLDLTKHDIETELEYLCYWSNHWISAKILKLNESATYYIVLRVLYIVCVITISCKYNKWLIAWVWAACFLWKGSYWTKY